MKTEKQVKKIIAQERKNQKAFDKAMEQALTKTLHAYEALFTNFKQEIDKWTLYGQSSSCRICKVMSSRETIKITGFEQNCAMCPLGSFQKCGESKLSQVCNDFGPYSVYVNNTRITLMYAIWDYEDVPNRDNLRKVIKAAKMRYKSLLETLDDNGWDYK